MIKSEKREQEEQSGQTPNSTAPKKDFLQKVDKDKALAYGVLAFLGLVAFDFGGSKYTYIFSALGLLITIGLLGLLSLKIDKNDKKALLYYGLPLIFFAVFSSFSFFWISNSLSSISTSSINLFGILSFFAIGYLSKNVKYVSLKGILIAIVIGFSLLALISLIASLCEYGPFYVIRYKDALYYQDAVGYTISNEYTILFGFRLAAVSLRYGLQYAFLSAACLSGLFFVSYKEDKALFLTLAIGGGIGLVALILVPYVTGLIFLIPVYLLAALLRFVKFPQNTPKWEKIVAWAGLGVGSILLLIVFINGIKDISALNKGALGRLFNNSRYLLPINQMLQGMFWTETNTGSGAVIAFNLGGLFGMNSSAQGIWEGTNFLPGFFIKNRIFEFNALYEGGLVAFIALLVFLVFAVISLRKYLHVEEKIPVEKIVLVSLLFAFFLYESFESDSAPLVVNGKFVTYVSPIFQNNIFLIMVLLLGIAYTPIFKVKTAMVPEANAHEN